MKPAFSLKKLSALSSSVKLKWLLFLLLLIVAAFRRFSLPQTPFADHDVNGYLNPALVYFKTGTFVHFNYRSFPYPLFLLVVIAITHSLKGIALAQHILGLLTGVLIFKIWDEPIFKGYAGKTIQVAATALQFTCAGYFLLSTGMIFLEHSLRPESTSIFLMVLVLFLLIKSLNQNSLSKNYLASALFLTLFTFIYSPRWGFALPLTVAYILFTIVRLEISFFKKLSLIIIPILLFLALVWLPERHLINKYDPQTDQLAARQFFYDHADVAKEVLKEDSKDTLTAKPFNLQTLRYIDSVMIIEPAHDFYFGPMGFNPDSLLYGKAGRTIDSLFRDHNDLAASFFRIYSKKIVTQGFTRYAQRVIQELGLYYWSNPNHERVYLYEPERSGHIYTLTKASVYNDMDSSSYPFKAYKSEVLAMPDHNIASRFRVLNILYFLFQLSFLPTLILFALIYFSKRFFFGKLSDSEVAFSETLANVCWLIFAIHFSLVATVAAIHTFGITRYVESIFPIALLLQTSCLFYLSIACFSIGKRVFQSRNKFVSYY